MTTAPPALPIAPPRRGGVGWAEVGAEPPPPAPPHRGGKFELQAGCSRARSQPRPSACTSPRTAITSGPTRAGSASAPGLGRRRPPRRPQVGQGASPRSSPRRSAISPRELAPARPGDHRLRPQHPRAAGADRLGAADGQACGCSPATASSTRFRRQSQRWAEAAGDRRWSTASPLERLARHRPKPAVST